MPEPTDERGAIVQWLMSKHYWNAKRSFERRWWEPRLKLANVIAAKVFFEAAKAIEKGAHHDD
jgi:hypothetical protein